MRAPFVIYADLESLLDKMNTFRNMNTFLVIIVYMQFI